MTRRLSSLGTHLCAFANRRRHRASAEADDARGRTVSSKALKASTRAERSVAWGERERERERERDERTIDRSGTDLDHQSSNRRSDRSRGEGWILGEG